MLIQNFPRLLELDRHLEAREIDENVGQNARWLGFLVSLFSRESNFY